MLTPDMSISQWWILAIVSGAALAVAGMTLTTSTARRVGSVLLPLAGAAAVVGQSAARGDSGKESLVLFTISALTLVILRFLYAKWISCQIALHGSGKPVDEVTGKQIAVFLLAFVAVATLVAVLIG